MKKMKKLFAMLLTLAMVFGMSMTSFAAKNGATLKVNGLATNANQTVDIYEIYRLDENDNNWVAADWTNGTGVTPENLNTKTILSALKTKALTVTNTAVKKTATSSNGTVSFDGLQAGAYLVLVTDSSNKTTYSTMVAKTYKYDDNQLIAPLDETVVAKAETYHTDKDVDKATAEVGELVTYTVKTVVPYQSKDADGQSKVTEFKISDQLTNATLYLTGNAIKGVNPVNTFTFNGVSKDDLKLDATLNGKTAFELNLISLVTDDNTYAGQEVVITYTALVGKNNTINNKATSTQDSNGTTTYTYNGNATITKKDLEEKHTLKGAQFAVYKIKDDKKLYAGIDAEGWFTGIWYEEGANGAVPDEAGKITTADNGTATVKGLTVGTYYFKEVVAPDGYSINTDDLSFKMITTTNENGTVTGVTAENPENIVMKDSKLSALPSTGGIGTTIFTIAGCVIMIAAAGLFFASRKKSDNK